MQGNIVFVLFFSLLTISLAADVTVYNYDDYFYRQPGTVVKPRAVSQHPWQVNCLQDDYVLDMYIVITHLPPSVTAQEITFIRGQETIKAQEIFPKLYRVNGFSVHSGVKIKLDLFRSEVLCSSLLLAEGILVEPESTERRAWDICGGMCLLEVDLTNQCVENTTTVKAVLENVTSPHDIIETTTIKVTTNGTTPPLDTQSENTTTVKAVLENITSPHDIIETTTIKVTTNGTNTTTSDHSTVIIISATFGVVLVLLVVIFVVWKCCWTNNSGTPQLPTTANNFEPFYLNLLFRQECEREIAQIDEHIYEEVGPPIYDEIAPSIDEDVYSPVYENIDPAMNEEADPPGRCSEQSTIMIAIIS